jgi:hypothetical protein
MINTKKVGRYRSMMKKVMMFTALSILVTALAIPAGFAQITQTKDGVNKIILKGKVDNMQMLGGYYIKGENPPGEFMIVNKNDKVFEKLMKSKKTIKIEGTLKGAEWVTVEKINGKKYTAESPGKEAAGKAK